MSGAASEKPELPPALGEQATMAAVPETAPGRPVEGFESGQRVAQGDPWLGREVAGRYAILERLGEGGMGMVYVAEHLHLKKRVAFKVIHAELACHEQLLLRFKREALATGQLDHPHITSAIDFGELTDGGAFMVMPLVRGRSLQAEMDAEGRFDPRRAARIGAQIADALSAAHAVGIVHRDLKPDNVLLEKRGDGSESAKVLDFGVASLAGRPEGLSVVAQPLTQAGTILGTPGYMSPEQASAGEVDHRTDLYALGVILWELCRGERLFDGENITAIFAKQFKSLPPALEIVGMSSGRRLSELVQRLLAWDKSQRPASAAEVRDALRAIAEQRDSTPSLPLPDFREWLVRAYPHRRWILLGVVLVIFLIPLLTRNKQPSAEPVLAPEEKSVGAQQPAPRAEEKGTPASAEPVRRDDLPELPGVFEEPAKTLLHGRKRAERRTVAKRLMRSQGVPPYLSLLAELELAVGCDERKELIAQMRKEQDPRVLPALERLAGSPRTGCAPLRLGDCQSCLRRDLDQTIGVLQAVQDP